MSLFAFVCWWGAGQHEVLSICTVGPHSVTGREVTQVRWTGAEGAGSAASLLMQTYFKLQCVVTHDSTSRRTLYILLQYTVLQLISKLRNYFNVRLSQDCIPRLVPGIGERMHGKRYLHMQSDGALPNKQSLTIQKTVFQL